MPLPGFLQPTYTGALQKLQTSLPGFFDTSGIEKAYGNQASSNLDQGRALAAAAGAGYANRAQQSGASSLGAGFAQAQAMLPIYGQNNALMSDLATKQLQARTGQAGAGIDISKAMAQLLATRQGLISDYTLGSRRLGQQQIQFGQELAQRNQQFNQDLGFRNQQLSQQGSQFEQNLGFQQQNAGTENRLKALQLAIGMPRQSYSWNTNNAGMPISGTDAASANAFGRQQNFYGGIQNSLRTII